jgi:chorismate mutase/prephenate dehydratase
MSIDEHRRKIDDLDRRIVALLNERATHALAIGREKRANNLDVFSPAREHQVLQKISAHTQGPLPGAAVRGIYREIISACRALEEDFRVVFLGPAATFTHMACRAQFGESAQFDPVPTISDVFLEVEKGNANFGVVPVTNSIEGAVNDTLDRFATSDLSICAESYLEVNQCFLANCPLDEVERIYSIPQALGQCKNWLREYVPHAEIIPVSSTSRGAEVAAGEPKAAAVATELAASTYGLEVLRRAIQDNPYNRTRFLTIGRVTNPPTGKDKTSLLFFVANRPGALYLALATLANSEINMTMIESRPTRLKPWEYMFFVDIQGHRDDPMIAAAVAELEKHCHLCRVLGSYPETE